MGYRIDFDAAAEKDLTKLGFVGARRVAMFLQERVAVLDNPRAIGEALRGSKLGHLWKYRVGEYRVLAEIQDKAVRILVVRIGNRRNVYLR